MRRLAAAAVLLGLLVPAAAHGAFPYTRAGGDPQDYTDLYLADESPGDLGGEEFKLAATPDPANGPSINANPVELNGVRGARVVDALDDADANPATVHDTAWELTTGRPDVTLAVMDSGIKWNDAGAMNDLRLKTRLNRGELPLPDNGRTTPLDGALACAGFTAAYDANGDGVFNVRDYACDTRIDLGDPRRVGPPGVLIPQDVLIAFSDGTDSDANGFADDIAGWDFLDDDNDAFDDVQYGHGTGEAEGSTGEADNGDTLGTCPNCMSIPMRVGDSFIADVNRFAQAVLYAADNDVEVVQSALGTLNNSSLSRAAVEYAYRHGTTLVVSAADEAAQHNNQPYLPHTILVNSVTRSPLPATPVPPGKSYLSFNGCTNFNAKITLAIPSTSCSSDAVGLASGYVGLIYSAAYNAYERGVLDPYADTSLCRLPAANPLSGDDRCLIAPNEVRQVFASGRIFPTASPPGSLAAGHQAEDINFAGSPAQSDNEPSCSPAPVPGCTNPGGPAGLLQAQVDANRTSFLGLQAVMRSYPARKGHDQFYGYGRPHMVRALGAVLSDPETPAPSRIPPTVELTSPQWNEQVDPAAPSLTVSGEVYARGAPYTCQVYVAPGHYPNNRLTTDTPPGDYQPVGNGACDGQTSRTATLDGALSSLDLAQLRARFPLDTQALGFGGREPGPTPQSSNGRPANEAYGFVVKVVATTVAGTTTMTGEDQRAAYLHRDQDMLAGFPKGIRRAAIGTAHPTGDGESSPVLADLDGDNANELVIAGSDGWVHALRRDGSELPGWPVRGDQPPLHTGGRAFATGAVSADVGGAILASVAVADGNRDGIPEVWAADLEGKVYGWRADGTRFFTRESNPAFSGKPLAPFVNERYDSADPGQAELNRVQHGFIASPVLADLDGAGGLEVVAAAMDRHLYAWHQDGSAVEGFPMLVVDQSKVASIDPQSEVVAFKPDSGARMQGAIIDTPAVADLSGDPRPEIVLGTNEEYEDSADGGFNVAPGSSGDLLQQIGDGSSEFREQCSNGGGPEEFCEALPDAPVDPANTRLYAIHPDGTAHPGDADGIAPGWPKKMGIVLAGLLPIVGEGVTGSPVVAPATCPSGGTGPKVGALANNGPAYVFNADGSSCYGQAGGGDVTLQTDGYANQPDHPLLPAVGHPAFADLDGAGVSFLVAGAGLNRALDLAFPEYQPLGQDFIAAWSVAGGGQLRPNFPQPVNDLQFLTGPSIADLDGAPGQEIVEGTASKDLAGLTAAGAPIGPAWPKVTTDWIVANPTIGSWGTTDTDPAARKVVVALTRSGYLNAYATSAPACSPSSWPRFHHDNANSGDLSRDATLPGRPTDIALATGALSFTSPGDDLMCGTPARYQVVTSQSPIDESNFAAATPLGDGPPPAAAGTGRLYNLPPGARRYVAVRAVDDQGNVGRVASFDRGPGAGGGGGGGGGDLKPGPCANPQPGDRRANILTGTRAGDRLLGFRGADRLLGRAGRDCLKGGRGRDRLRGGRGTDLLKARDGARDLVDCGRGGPDRAVVDRRDRVRRCERVRGPRRR